MNEKGHKKCSPPQKKIYDGLCSYKCGKNCCPGLFPDNAVPFRLIFREENLLKFYHSGFGDGAEFTVNDDFCIDAPDINNALDGLDLTSNASG